ncbi:hypothetical protein ACKVWC_005032 [Pyricularia oryzae]|nr:hypothetical protein MCOR05_009404 [Pyricularia oryzae]
MGKNLNSKRRKRTTNWTTENIEPDLLRLDPVIISVDQEIILENPNAGFRDSISQFSCSLTRDFECISVREWASGGNKQTRHNSNGICLFGCSSAGTTSSRP